MSLSLGERVFVIPPTIIAAFWATAGSSKRACKNGKSWVTYPWKPPISGFGYQPFPV